MIAAPEKTTLHPNAAPQKNGPSTNFPDNLCLIKGIGNTIKRKLYAKGIFTWAELAATEPTVLRAYLADLVVNQPERWPKQAAILAKKYNRENAHYQGPLPDEFSLISGIGPQVEQHLYMHGIYTFAQLAQTPYGQLRQILQPLKLKNWTNLRLWLAKAAELARQPSPTQLHH